MPAKWTARVLVSCLVAISPTGAVRGSESPPQDLQLRSSLAATEVGYRYYLTSSNYQTDEAATACADGYHMASLWEILDPTNLVYAVNHPAAFTRADSGEGPPAGWNGWVRTGFVSSGSNAAGSANCQAWTSVSGSDYGTTVKLPTDWVTTPNEIGVWDATAFGCNLTGPVWCVSDEPAGIFLDGFESGGTGAWSATVP